MSKIGIYPPPKSHAITLISTPKTTSFSSLFSKKASLHSMKALKKLCLVENPHLLAHGSPVHPINLLKECELYEKGLEFSKNRFRI